MSIVKPAREPNTADALEVKRFLREVATRLSYHQMTGDPSGSLTPRWVGDTCIDQTTGDIYKSNGLTAASWQKTTYAEGSLGDHGTLQGLSDDDHTQYYDITRHTKTVHDALALDHGLLTGLTDDDHTQYIRHALVTAANDFLVASASATVVKKTLAQTKVILGLPNFVDRGDPAAWDLDLAGMTTDGAWHDWDLSSIVPAGAVAVLLFSQVKDDATNSFLMFRKNGNSNEYNVAANRTQEVSIYTGMQHTVFLDANRVIEYKATNTTFTDIYTVVSGWWI
jgi:hypothetical protein